MSKAEAKASVEDMGKFVEFMKTGKVSPRERPILFRSEMVRAILDGRKTQTRRVMKPQAPDIDPSLIEVKRFHPTVVAKDGEESPGDEIFGACDEYGEWGAKCPYGQPGERLWVRETWAQTVHNGIQYRADWGAGVSGWKPSIHMPRAACRLVLEVTGVRVERVQDISETDARAEGIIGGLSESGTSGWGSGEGMPDIYKAKWGFKALWDTMRADTEWAWSKNPWVWVIDFNRCVSPPKEVNKDG